MVRIPSWFIWAMDLLIYSKIGYWVKPVIRHKYHALTRLMCVGNSGVESVKPYSFFECLLWRFIRAKVECLQWVEVVYFTLN